MEVVCWPYINEKQQIRLVSLDGVALYWILKCVVHHMI